MSVAHGENGAFVPCEKRPSVVWGLPPIRRGMLHLRQVQVAGAEEVGAAVAHLQLEFGVAAEVAQVVAGKGVAQGILLPAVDGGISHGAAAPFFIIRCQSDFFTHFVRSVFHSSRRELFHDSIQHSPLFR